MSDSDDRIKELIERNPNVDGEQLKEMRKLHDRLEREGIAKPRYAIVSPYARRPLRRSAARAWPSQAEGFDS